MTPKPESRIKSLEQRVTDVEASIVELSSDTAEELRAIRQEIKASYKEIGDFFVKLDSGLETLKAETKEDLGKLENRLDRIEATMATKDDISALKATQERQEQLLQQILAKLS